MAVSRRSFLAGLTGMLSLIALAALPASGHPGPHRHPHRPRVRAHRRARRHTRRVRRRVRRRAHWRFVHGRRLLVVPLAVAVGWELLVEDRIVVVTHVHTDRVIVEHADGQTEEFAVIKEDTDDNSIELEGSETDG